MTVHTPFRRYSLSLMLALAAALLLAACNQPSPPAVSTVVYKIQVAQDGAYRLTRAQLPGLTTEEFAADRLSLTRNGTPAPFTMLDEGSDKALYFYGQGLADDSATRAHAELRRRLG